MVRLRDELDLATLTNIARSYTSKFDEYGCQCVSLEKISETEIPSLKDSIQDARVERNPDVSIPAQTSTTQFVHHSPGDEDEGNPGISVPSQASPSIPAPHSLRDRDARSRETRFHRLRLLNKTAICRCPGTVHAIHPKRIEL